MALRTCPNCNHEVDEGAERCPNCGQVLAAASAGEAPSEEAEARTPHPTEAEAATATDDGPVTTPAGPAPGGGPLAGLQWSAILAGFASFLVASILFQLLLPLQIAPIATLVAGMLVTSWVAKRRKLLHAALAVLLYLVVNFVLALFLAPPAAPGGGGGAP